MAIGGMDIGMDVTEQGDSAVLAVRGEVDVSTAPKLRQQIVELATAGHRRVVIDLTSVDFLDSTGLGVLVGGLKRLRSLGGDLVLCGAQPRIQKVFEITGLTQVFSMFDDADGAVAG